MGREPERGWGVKRGNHEEAGKCGGRVDEDKGTSHVARAEARAEFGEMRIAGALFFFFNHHVSVLRGGEWKTESRREREKNTSTCCPRTRQGSDWNDYTSKFIVRTVQSLSLRPWN